MITQALKEDACGHDITTQILIPKNKISEAKILIKGKAVICGLILVQKIFQKLDKNIQFHSFCNDGDLIKEKTCIASIKGKTRALLTGERVALNFLGHLSGIATTTYHFVQRIHGLKTKILDTRKTTPGLRELEKYAVRCGGAHNHRRDLNEMILIKDNHLEALQYQMSIAQLLRRIKNRTNKTIEIEVDHFIQFKEALRENPDIILLDNMNPRQLKEAVTILKTINPKKKPLLEASGGITLSNVRSIAKTGVDRISIGALTHSHKSIDFSMELRPTNKI